MLGTKTCAIDSISLRVQTKFLTHEPVTELNENTTDHMIESASLNMIKSMLDKYIAKIDVTVAAFSFDSMNHIALLNECKKIRNQIRLKLNLPPVQSALPQDGPTDFQKSAANQNGNLFSKYIPKSTTFMNRKELANNTAGQLSNRFDQNDFYVRVNAPVKGRDVHIPTIIKLVFSK